MEFKKAIILCGPQGSGKSRLSRIMSEGKRTRIFDKKFHGIIYDDTEVVIVDDFNFKKDDIEYFINYFTTGLVTAKLIITSDCEMNDIILGEHNKLFDIFELKACK